jgi:hypothetical protein
MINRFIQALMVAWILSCFGLDKILVQGVNDLLGTDLTAPAYYVLFGLLGVAEYIVECFIHKKQDQEYSDEQDTEII